MIFQHRSIASYLRSVLADRESRGKYSLRTMAKDLELSPAYLSQLMSAKKHLSPERRLVVARHLGLSESQARYFYLLAQRDSAPSDEIRHQIDTQLNDLSHADAGEAVLADRFHAISDWYHVPILEMSYLSDFTLSPEAVADKLGISVETASEAIERLERLGLLARLDDGAPGYRKTGRNVVFRTSALDEAFVRFHKQMIGLSLHALEGHAVEERLMMSQTFCIDPSQLGEARELTRQYLQRMAHLFETAPKHTRTYQLNVQFFDLTDGRDKSTVASESGTGVAD